MKQNSKRRGRRTLSLSLLTLLAAAVGLSASQTRQGNTEVANDFPGQDIGAKINAADKAFGPSTGEILVRDGGTITTQIVISAGHVLRLGPGTYTTKTANTPILLKSNSSLIGSGWNSIIVESNAPGQFFVIRGHNGSLAVQNSDSNITIRDLQVLGGNPGFDSAPQTISLGNCSNCTVDHVWLNGTRAIGIQVGGSSSTGKFAENVKVINCQFTRVASQNLALVNGRNITFEGNKFLRPGQRGGPGNTSIDLEPNESTDWLENVIIRNNYIDHRGSEMPTTGNGIVVQNTTGTPHAINILVEKNTIIGGENRGRVTNVLSNGIFVNGTLRDVTVKDNVITRTGQAGIRIAGMRITVTNNQLTDVGGGGTPGFLVENLTDSQIIGNTFTYSGNGPSDFRIVFIGNNKRNTFQGNRGFQMQGPNR